MYRLITFILLCANICIADIFAATVKECEVDSMYNDTLIVGKKVICGQKIYPQRDDVITACLAHEKRLYLVGKLKDTLLVITDAPALFLMMHSAMSTSSISRAHTINVSRKSRGRHCMYM